MEQKSKNRKAFLDIAITALEEHQKASAKLVSQNVRFTQTQRKAMCAQCFNHALVAIVFSCSYLEAVLYCYGRARFGRHYQDTAVYETKLQALGISEATLLAQARQLRIVRRELMHEEEMEIDNREPSKVYVSQNEAEKAVALVLEIKRLLKD